MLIYCIYSMSQEVSWISQAFSIQSLWGRLSLLEEHCSLILPRSPPSAKSNTRQLDIWEKHFSLVALNAQIFVIISLLYPPLWR